jgi:C1A family cysteine protease
MVVYDQSTFQVLQAETEDPAGALWEQWQVQNGKSYADPDEAQYRFQVFKSNLAKIEASNANPANTYTLGLTKFADLTSEEFSATYNGYRPNLAARNEEPMAPRALPASVNWTAAGAVTPIKNQGQCGSCWSFSTTGSLEGLHQISNGTLLSFSEQQIMDCSWLYGNKGCDGGEMTKAMDYVHDKGDMLESDYPYLAKSSLICKYKADEVVNHISGHKDVVHNNVTELMTAVVQQPISIGVEANQDAWQLYKGGVVNGNCGQQLDHGVLAVGYGVSNTNVSYWIVKNSWGADWGMAGYILIERSQENLCGVLSSPSYPIN